MLDPEKRKLALSRNPLFSLLSTDDLKTVESQLEEKQFRLGDVVVRQGELAAAYYLIVSGKARVVDDEKNLTLATIGPGDGFGERSLKSHSPATATVRASGKLDVLKLTQERFQQLTHDCPALDKSVDDTIRHHDAFNALKRLEIFSELSKEDVLKLLGKVEQIILAEDDFLFHQGDVGDAAFVVMEGKIQVFKEDTRKILSILRPGAVLGEISLVKHQPRLAGARAMAPTRLLKLSQEVFNETLPEIRGRVESIIHNRLLQFEAFKEDKSAGTEDREQAQIETRLVRLPIGVAKPKVNLAVTNDAHLAGLACVQMMSLAHAGKSPPKLNSWITAHLHTSVTDDLQSIAWRLDEAGLLTRLIRVQSKDLNLVKLPAIVMDAEGVPCVLFAISGSQVFIGHPVKGLLTQRREDFLKTFDGHVLLGAVVPEFGKAGQGVLSIIKAYLPLLKSHKGHLVWVLALSALVTVMGMAAPIFSQTIIDKVLVFSDRSLLKLMLLGMVFVTIGNLLSSAFKALLLVSVFQRLEALVNLRLFHHILRVPFDRYQKFDVGDYLSRFQENGKLLGMVSSTGASLALDTLMSVIYLGMLLSQNPMLTGIGLIFVALTAGMMVLASPKLRTNDEKVFQRGAKHSNFMVQSVSGIMTIKALAKGNDYYRESMNSYSRLQSVVMEGARYGFLLQVASEAIEATATLCVLAAGATAVLGGKMTVGEFVAFNAVYGMLMGPLMSLAGKWDEIQELKISYQRVNDLLALPVEHSELNLELQELKGHVRIENVTFRYDGAEKDTLAGVTLEVQPGQKVAFVGRSGCGKSTLVNLLMGLFKPTTGKIYLDGADVETLNPASLRRHFGVVEQQPYLFSGSILENITKAHPDMPYDTAMAAATVAGVREFTDRMPMGLNTKLGEGGMGLSGGQRQRVAIARATAANPGILILDEATSALDNETEAVIQKNLDNIMKGRTTFVIAHRLSTIMNSDIIVVMSEGRITEQGSHAELMEKKGLYYYLYMASTEGTG